jgi:hypothetical protein
MCMHHSEVELGNEERKRETVAHGGQAKGGGGVCDDGRARGWEGARWAVPTPFPDTQV